MRGQMTSLKTPRPQLTCLTVHKHKQRTLHGMLLKVERMAFMYIFQPARSTDCDQSVAGKDGDEKSDKNLSKDKYYIYEELYSRPFITTDSKIPANLLHLSHSFGYDCGRRDNLQLLDEKTLMFIAGNLLILLDVNTKKQRYLRSCSGGGIGIIMAHPTKKYFAVGEKGEKPCIIVYEYPSLLPYRILRGGTEVAYSFVDFNCDGNLLASVGSAPDYMLTLWEWKQEHVKLRCKAISQDVYRVTFSPDNPGQLTTSGSEHIKFWKMYSTFTGLKLEGLLGRFDKTTRTDIDAYMDLPDGKVVSGSSWGNMLLWDRGLIKVEICRKGGRTCHAGPIKQFAQEEGELMTIGSDGVIRGWDFESIYTADCIDHSGMFEIEPMNEMVIGRNVSLSSMVKSPLPDSFIWFAQDSNGGIWKLDLSFSNTTQDPECLFSFHAGGIQGMDVSRVSHLMATTALDRSVKVFDFLAKTELTTSRFKQGGTALTWAPPLVNKKGGLLVTGFEDGVVRLLELYNPQILPAVAGHNHNGEATLCLKQALKPHNAPVTAFAYERNGEVFATGSLDCTVFFFSVGEKYNPIGFIKVPGPVQALEWSPQSHTKNTLLILCLNGNVVEVQCPDPVTQNLSKTYQLSGLLTRSFNFRSIKSRIKREEEIARQQITKEKKRRALEEQVKKAMEQGREPTEEELQKKEEEQGEELPAIYSPDQPSPLYCGFYSQPGSFWLSMGGYDSGFLYHCKFSEKQDEEPVQCQDEPFDFLPVHNADQDPIRTITFSSNRQLMLCGMHSGSIRAYPIQPGDLNLTSMQAYWALNIHDNQYGHLRHICCSHDDQFVLTAGEDGNIFSFALLPPEELKEVLHRKRAQVPSPRIGLETEGVALDIEDPAAYSIETAQQKLETDRLHKEAELRKVKRRQKFAELQSDFKKLQHENQSLPEHVCFGCEELELDPRFREETERVKALRVREVRKELAWEVEHHNIGLKKLQERFRGSLESDMVTVFAIYSEHSVTTYRLLTERLHQLQQQDEARMPSGPASQEKTKSRAEPGKECNPTEEEQEDLPSEAVLTKPVTQPAGLKLPSQQAEKLRKAAEKAEQARAKIQKRKREWAELYSAKPDENCEDPQGVLAIRHAMENMGDFKLKTAKDFTVPEHRRMNTERKRAELVALEEKVHEKKVEMNSRIIALRETKVSLVTWLRSQNRRVQQIQRRLAPHLHRHYPALPSLLPEEIPKRKSCYSRAMLECYGALKAQRASTESREHTEGSLTLLEQLEKEMEGQEKMEEEEEEEEEGDRTACPPVRSEIREVETLVSEGVGLSELEEEVRRMEEMRLIYEQDSLLEQMESAVWRFDAELRLLHHEKLDLDCQMKQADLRHVTLFQELLLLREFEKRENALQERLNACMEEESIAASKLEEHNVQLEMKCREVAKLQDREKAVTAAFQASLGENNKFVDFLTKVFKKRIKRVKKKEEIREEEEERDSDEDSFEEEDWDDDEDESSSESGGISLDYGVCPPNCDPDLFEKTVQLRERRLDLEELLVEERKSADALKKECDALVKKNTALQSSVKAAEGDLETLNREKQLKLNDLDVEVPLRLHQIELLNNGKVPSNLSPTLVLNTSALVRLQERVKELQVEKNQQRDVDRQAHKQQHSQLIYDHKDMETKCRVLEEHCKQQMMMKFGMLVDLEALQSLSGSRNLEEMKQESCFQEAACGNDIKLWDTKVSEAREALMEMTRGHTERLLNMNSFLCQEKQLGDQLHERQRKLGGQSQDERRQADENEICRLQELVEIQAQEVEALRREISILSHKGGSILPPFQAPLPPSAHPSPSQ
ncbi:cilia- and flagella-associated protein 44 [Lampris incognitus]|uniref:cilia- and flagella-associated protein 44 n=1 Tax=Lampris incognitus TaxID=2546036 RepID=UPI0024B53444|nr:cilia- and flagella-associated protein 44 [Lampris incognitus]